uniref:Uncharacterized protein n=1 Tax=Parastrongyloides trichosuri TaxID=131310 RepID=A0A0N4Z115_PARTI
MKFIIAFITLAIIAVNALPVANNGNSKVSMLNDNDIEYGQEFLDDDKVTSKEDGEKKGIELKGHETNRILKVTDEDGNVKEYKEVVLNPGDFIPNIINQDEEEDEEGEEDEEFSDELDKTSIDEVLRHYVSKENRNKLNSYLDDFKSISALSSLKSEEDSDDLNRGNGEKKSFSFDLKKIISENLVKLTELFD